MLKISHMLAVTLTVPAYSQGAIGQLSGFVADIKVSGEKYVEEDMFKDLQENIKTFEETEAKRLEEKEIKKAKQCISSDSCTIPRKGNINESAHLAKLNKYYAAQDNSPTSKSFTKVNLNYCVKWEEVETCSNKLICKLVCVTVTASMTSGTGLAIGSVICNEACETIPECSKSQKCVQWSSY